MNILTKLLPIFFHKKSTDPRPPIVATKKQIMKMNERCMKYKRENT